MKKILFFIPVIVLIVGLFIFMKQKDETIINIAETEIPGRKVTETELTPELLAQIDPLLVIEYSKGHPVINYSALFDYLSWSTDYKGVPVTERYKKEFKDEALVHKFNLTMYNMIGTHANYDGDVMMECYIEDANVYRSDEMIIEKQYFKYTTDDKGFIDTVEFDHVEKFRDLNRVPIFYPNSITYKGLLDMGISTYLELLCYGLDYMKYKRDILSDEYLLTLDLATENNNLKEIALTEHLKNDYDINIGLLDKELISKSKSINECIYIDVDTSSAHKKGISEFSFPTILRFNNETINYSLIVKIDEKDYLDVLSLEKNNYK